MQGAATASPGRNDTADFAGCGATAAATTPSEETCEKDLVRVRDLRLEDYKRLPWYLLNPFTGLWYEMLFNIKPKFAAVKDAMSVIALIDALLLTVVLTIPLSMSRSELQEIDDLFLDPTFNPSLWFTKKFGFGNSLVPGSGSTLQEGFSNITTLLSFQYTVAICCLASSLLSIIETYTFGVVSDIEEDSERFRIWWFFARWLILAQIVLTIVGVFYTFWSFNLLVTMKFAGLTPQPECYLADSAGNLQLSPDERARWGNRLRCPQEYNGFAQWTYLMTAAIGSLGILCIANVPMAAARARRGQK